MSTEISTFWRVCAKPAIEEPIGFQIPNYPQWKEEFIAELQDKFDICKPQRERVEWLKFGF